MVLGPSLEMIGYASCTLQAAFPYMPGLLSFRKGPEAIRAMKKLMPRPALLFVEGCGINHTRMAGLCLLHWHTTRSAHPGVTKDVLCGERELPEKAGMATPLFYDGEQVWHLLKSKDGCRPIVIAPGHRVSMQSSLELTCNSLLITSF
jgi:deoxyribonuclease V